MLENHNHNVTTPTSCITSALLLAATNVTPESVAAVARVIDNIGVDGPQPGAGLLRFETPQHGFLLTPYLVGADNCQCTIDVRVWRRVRLKGDSNKPTRHQWTSLLLARLVCTASAATGIADGHIPVASRTCDLITASVDRTPGGVKIYQKAGGGDDEPAAVLIDCIGSEFVTLHFNTQGLGSAATAANATIAGLNNG